MRAPCADFIHHFIVATLLDIQIFNGKIFLYFRYNGRKYERRINY